MPRFRVVSIFLEERSETVSEAKTPEQAAAEHIAHLPFEDGLDYPADFWSIVVPIAEGKVEIDLVRTEKADGWSWPQGETLTWPMNVEVAAELADLV